MKNHDRPASVAVIGAGWAGLSAAWRLRASGHNVTVHEMAPAAGGRARTAVLRLADRDLHLDNGQHMLIGAYRDTLTLLRKAHDLQDDAPIPGLTRIPLTIESARFRLQARGPGQFGLLRGIMSARGLSTTTRLRIVAMMVRLRRDGWRTPPSETVDALLARMQQPQQAIAALWSPLCLAALNTPLARASAQVFVNVLHDAMFGAARGSDFLVPASTLGALFADPMIRSLKSMGVRCQMGNPISALTPLPSGRWEILGRNEPEDHDAVVLATSPSGAARLLRPLLPQAARRLDSFQFESIITVYLAWSREQAPVLPLLTRLDDDPGAGQPAQWLFAREPQDDLVLAAAVISAPPQDTDQDNADVTRAVIAQVQGQLGLPAPLDARAVNEKRATFSCVPDRPSLDSDQVDGHELPAGLRLAGDYCWARYPSTLEGAVRSGARAARSISAQLAQSSSDQASSSA